MEKKKGKILPIILIIVLIAILILLTITIRKIIIINDLNEKVIAQNSKTNIFMKSHSDSLEEEIYKKDNVVKAIFDNKETQIKTTQITNNTTRLLYTESNSEKTLESYSDTTNYGNIIPNSVNTLGFLNSITFSISSNIYTDTFNGKECYVLINNKNPNWFIPQECKDLKIYIEKESGLPLKTIEVYDNGQEKTTTYEYFFDVVTDDDVKPLDNSQYISK